VAGRARCAEFGKTVGVHSLPGRTKEEVRVTGGVLEPPCYNAPSVRTDPHPAKPLQHSRRQIRMAGGPTRRSHFSIAEGKSVWPVVWGAGVRTPRLVRPAWAITKQKKGNVRKE